MNSSKTSSGGFRAHYDASQYRRDTWSEFKHRTARLERTASRGGDTATLRFDAAEALDVIEQIERYQAFPGLSACRDLRRSLRRGMFRALAQQVARIARLLVSDAYRRRSTDVAIDQDGDPAAPGESTAVDHALSTESRPYFEVLLVDDLSPEEEAEFRARLLAMRREDDKFVYDVVVVSSAEDALIAVQVNPNIQTCVLRYSFPFESRTALPELRDHLAILDMEKLAAMPDQERSPRLGRALKSLRPELDLFLNTDDPVENIAGEADGDFRRVFYHQEDYLELHLSILKGISERYETPFFTALRQYSQKPTGVFHALPISRGKSITRSNWIQDMGKFYGTNIFLAETSATSGGLDSLLQPHGPLKRAQAQAARAFGARRTFFVTNGTSAANKIVMQALTRPGDIVLVSHDCHKSHHYALMLAGAYPIYMDPYPLHEYTMYGAVPLREIKRHLLELRRAGKLDRVRMLLLTNCTFDGIVYHPERVMREVLAIKPDMVFVWDEAWFGFARFVPTYRQRTAMRAARRLYHELRSEEYRARHEAWQRATEALDPDDDATWLDRELLPDPDQVRLRVYATQSTHKTLTALRQGSMIHVYDLDFERRASDAFREAYMTYTSTSPNYQILASLDVGRRQVELEGYELVKRQIELAMLLRKCIEEHELLSKYFTSLTVKDLIPASMRPSGLEVFYDRETGFQQMERAWRDDEFALDPTRVTLHVGRTGIDGDTLKKILMDNHDIQINKTSRNTLLFMLNIGTTRGAVAYLLKVLVNLAKELDEKREDQSVMERRILDGKIASLTENLPPLPNFSHFHRAFVPDRRGDTPEGDMRAAFFLAYDADACEYLPMDGSVAKAIASGREVVSASFVTPYPPGFPVLVPGQVISADILAYMKALDVKEIHGYKAEYGFRVFTQEALDALRPAPTPKARETAESPR
jgi:arginine decarboxylase